jgi:hypothetical protein
VPCATGGTRSGGPLKLLADRDHEHPEDEDGEDAGEADEEDAGAAHEGGTLPGARAGEGKILMACVVQCICTLVLGAMLGYGLAVLLKHGPPL